MKRWFNDKMNRKFYHEIILTKEEARSFYELLKDEEYLGEREEE